MKQASTRYHFKVKDSGTRTEEEIKDWYKPGPVHISYMTPEELEKARAERDERRAVFKRFRGKKKLNQDFKEYLLTQCNQTIRRKHLLKRK